MGIPIRKTSRRRFGKALSAWTASAGMAAPALAQDKKSEQAESSSSTLLPCASNLSGAANPRLAEFDLPRAAEPAFTSKVRS